jgi:hypothetical protein
MQPTTLKELEWIHDCVLLNVLYDASSDAGRSIKLVMRCPTDLGYAPWEGKRLQIVAADVALMKHVLWGVAGPETIDAIRSGVSDAVRESTMEARRMGARFPSLEFTISFSSGSAIELICQEVQVDVRV